MSDAPAAANVVPAAGRKFVVIGILLALAGPAGYAALIAAHRLPMPWFLPISATLGAILIAASLWQARRVGRIVALVVVLLLAGAEWMFVFATRLPAYTGPIAIGQPFEPVAPLIGTGGKIKTNWYFLSAISSSKVRFS